jgi:hypothetical protein
MVIHSVDNSLVVSSLLGLNFIALVRAYLSLFGLIVILII